VEHGQRRGGPAHGVDPPAGGMALGLGEVLESDCQGTSLSADGRPPDLPVGGHEFCPLVATKLPGVAAGPAVIDHVSGVTPLPAMAWDRRTDSPVVWQTWAWCRSRSTVAVASVLGISSSKPTGTGTRSLRAKPRVTWVFSRPACLLVFEA
jgi:hypothetical protein